VCSIRTQRLRSTILLLSPAASGALVTYPTGQTRSGEASTIIFSKYSRWICSFPSMRAAENTDMASITLQYLAQFVQDTSYQYLYRKDNSCAAFDLASSRLRHHCIRIRECDDRTLPQVTLHKPRARLNSRESSGMEKIREGNCQQTQSSLNRVTPLSTRSRHEACREVR